MLHLFFKSRIFVEFITVNYCFFSYYRILGDESGGGDRKKKRTILKDYMILFGKMG